MVLCTSKKKIRNRIVEENRENMEQLLEEINQIILKLPEDKLQPVLEYLKEVEKTTDENPKTAKLVNKIFEEDASLLNRLAQ